MYSEYASDLQVVSLYLDAYRKTYRSSLLDLAEAVFLTTCRNLPRVPDAKCVSLYREALFRFPTFVVMVNRVNGWVAASRGNSAYDEIVNCFSRYMVHVEWADIVRRVRSGPCPEGW
jgi:hypothetical protein